MLHTLILTALLQTPPATQETPPDANSIVAEYKDGLRFRTADGRFELMLKASMMVHARAILDHPDDAARVPNDGAWIKLLRPDMRLKLGPDFEARLQTDFPTGSASSTVGTLQDGWLAWKRWKEFSLRVGQFKEPFGQEEWMGFEWVDLPEKPTVNRLGPGRDIGFMAYGALGDGLFEYHVGAFNGQGRAVLDGNDETDLAARIRLRPFHAAGDDSLLHDLRLGLAATVGDVDSASFNALDLKTGMLEIAFLDATAGALDGLRTRLGVELAWVHGSWALRGEVIRREDRVDIGAFDDENVSTLGWMVQGTWVLTGERKPMEARLKPAAPFDPGAGTWGAFEVAVRISAVEVGDDIFDLGVASAATNAREVTEVAVGINWYLNDWVRISPAIAVESFGDDVTFADGRTEDSAAGFIIRFQVVF